METSDLSSFSFYVSTWYGRSDKVINIKHFRQSYGQENNHYYSKYEMVKLKRLSYCILKKDLILYTGNVMTTHFFHLVIHFLVISQEKALCSMKKIFK